MLSFYLSMVNSDEEKELITELYNRYEQDMYKVAYGILHNKEDAEDAVSDAFIRIINNLHKIDTISSPRTRAFVVIIVKNISIDMYNSNKKHNTVDIDEIEIMDNSLSVEDIVFSQYNADVLKAALLKLPKTYYEILYLYTSNDCSINELSELMGIAYENCKSRLNRAKNKLRLILEDKDG